MAKGRKVSKGKKEAVKQTVKQPAKKAASTPVETARSTRGSSRATPEKKQAQKRKASPSPAPKQSATVSKKTKSASQSPAPNTRGKPSRGSSASAAKSNPTARQPRSSSQKEDVRQTRVTRAVVEDVEAKSSPKVKSTPTKTAASTKRSQEPATPTQRRGRSSTPKAKVAPKSKETPSTKGTPKKNEKTRGRSVSSSGKQSSPVKKPTPQTTPKGKAGTPRSRSATPKAATPKQKPATPSQKAAEKTSSKPVTPKNTATPQKATTPKQKTPTPKKATPSPKAVRTTPKKPTPTKSPAARSSRSSPRKSSTPSKTKEVEEEKTEDVEEEKLVDSGAIPTEEISKVVDEVADRKEDPVADNIQPQKEDDIDKSSEKEAMEVEQEMQEKIEVVQEINPNQPEIELKKPEPDDDTNVENDVADNDLADEAGSDNEDSQKLMDEDGEQERTEEAEANSEIERTEEAEAVVIDDANIETAEEDPDELKGKSTDQETNETTESNSYVGSMEPCIEQEQKVKNVIEQDLNEKDMEVSVQQAETETDIIETNETAARETEDEKVSYVEKDELEKASVVAQADETERMEELVAGLGDGESDVGVDEAHIPDTVGEIGSGDIGEIKPESELKYQAGVQDVVEVQGIEREESDVNTTGIEIAQEVGELTEDPSITNDLQLNGVEGSSSLSNGEQLSQKRKHDEMDDDNLQSAKRIRVSEDLENTEETYGNSAASADILNDYVVIEMEDVPPSKSQEVIESLPKDVQNVSNETLTVEQTETQSETNPVYSRIFTPNPKFGSAPDNSKQFSIVSYNVLADCHLFRNDYSYTHPDLLKPSYRLNKLMEEIEFLDADIVCLQEVDPNFFQDKLMPRMKGHGYEGIHKKRTEDFFDEGEATFYRTSRFTLVDVSLHRVADLVEKEFVEGMDPTIQAAVRHYMDRSDVLVITRLQCNNTGQQITVGNIHVTWGEMKVPDVQSLQIACAIKEIVRKAGAESYPHIICGDFNSEPFSPGYLMAKNGYLSDEGTIDQLQQLHNLQFPDGRTDALVNCLWTGFQHTSSSLKSVYFETKGSEPEVTSYNRGMCACVDYQFYSSSSLDAVGVLQTAAKDRIMETGGTPNCYFPSDHVSLKAVFSFK